MVSKEGNSFNIQNKNVSRKYITYILYLIIFYLQHNLQYALMGI